MASGSDSERTQPQKVRRSADQEFPESVIVGWVAEDISIEFRTVGAQVGVCYDEELVITGFGEEGTTFVEHNKQHPEAPIMLNDKIISANGVDMSTAAEFKAELAEMDLVFCGVRRLVRTEKRHIE